MIVLTRSEIASLLAMPDTIEAVEAGFARLSAGDVVMPQRIAMPIAPRNGLHLSMPAYVAGEPETLAVKIVSVYRDNPATYGLPMIQGVLLLHDARTGTPLALMDAEHVTAMRTGAASGAATKHLARSDAHTLTLFGAGALAAAQLEAMCTVRDIQRAYVLTRTGEKDAHFAEQMAQRLAIDVIPTRDVRQAVERADVICTATSSATPLFDGAWLQPGTHINAVGAYTRSVRELDATAIRRSRVFVDHHVAAHTEAGDILLAIDEGAISYDYIAGEVGDLILGKIAGRTDESAITVFKSVGLAMQDAMTAALVYTLAATAGIGHRIDL